MFAPSLESSTRPITWPFLTFLPSCTAGAGGLSGVLLQLDPHGRRPEIDILERRLALVFFHLQPLAQLRQRDAAVLLHRVDLDGLLLHELQAGGAAVLLAVVARLFRVEILGTSVERAESARAAQLRPLIPDVAAGQSEARDCA